MNRRAVPLAVLLLALPVVAVAGGDARIETVRGVAHLDVGDGRVLPVVHGPFSALLARRPGKKVQGSFEVELRNAQLMVRVDAVQGIDLRRLPADPSMVDGAEWHLMSLPTKEADGSSSSVVVDGRAFAPVLRELARRQEVELFVRMTPGMFEGERKGELLGLKVAARTAVAVHAAPGSSAPSESFEPGAPIVVTRLAGDWAEVSAPGGARGFVRVAALLPEGLPKAGLASLGRQRR
jgi:hypothetical protein